MSTQSFILSRSIKWLPGTSRDRVIRSKLSPRSGSVALSLLNSIHKKRGHKEKKKEKNGSGIHSVVDILQDFSKFWNTWWVASSLIGTLLWHVLHTAGSIYLFKVNNGNTRTRCENCSKLIIKTLFCAFIVDPGQVNGGRGVIKILNWIEVNLKFSIFTSPSGNKLYYFESYVCVY